MTDYTAYLPTCYYLRQSGPLFISLMPQAFKGQCRDLLKGFVTRSTLRILTCGWVVCQKLEKFDIISNN
jgi:hypothetical protein